MQFRQFLENREDFFQLAQLQRDIPEKMMLRFQFLMGGGVMSYAVEHAGDLTHRMSEKATFGTAGYEFVKKKVENLLRLLNQGYGLWL